MHNKISSDLSVSTWGDIFELTIEETYYDSEKSILLDKYEVIALLKAANKFIDGHENAKPNKCPSGDGSRQD